MRALLVPSVLAAFFVSGAAALSFERVWFDLAGLALGNDVWASTAVLSAFMLGLAAGHALAARRPAFFRRISAFALLELVAGVSGIALVLGFGVVEAHFAVLVAGVFERPWLLNGARTLAAFVLLFVPSAAMGAGLPTLAGALERGPGDYGRLLGALYGANTAGGVLGVAFAEAFMIPEWGLRATGVAAGAAELGVAALALFLSRRIPVTASADGERAEWDLVAAPWLFCAAACGFFLLGLEVVWLRILTLFVDDTSSAFAAVLAVVLAGIAAGGLCAAVFVKRFEAAAARVDRTAYVCGVAGLVGYLAYPSALQRFYVPEAPPWRIALVAAPLVLPSAICSGILFTQIGMALRRSSPSGVVATAELGAVNAVGGGLGAALVGGMLLPALGMERALFLLLASYGIVGLVGSFRAPGARVARWFELAAFAAFMAFFPFGRVRDFVEASAGRWTQDAGRVTEVKETATNTIVHVRHEIAGLPTYDRILTDAYSMTANDFFARRYMKLFVYLPVALSPRVDSALVLGFGIGNTASALADTKEVKRIDVVDTSKEMLDLSRRVLGRVEHPVLDDPRVHVHVADARYFLRSTDGTYTLITGEPPPPTMARVASLYSREYFTLIRDHLAPSGMVTYWLPAMSLSGPALLSIVHGFCDVFADCALWNGAGENFVLSGSREPHTPVDDARYFAQWRDPIVGQEIRALGFEFPGQLGATFVGDAKFLTAQAESAPPATDDFPKRVTIRGTGDEREALLGAWRDTRAARERFAHSELIRRWFPPSARRQSLQHFENQRLIADLLSPGPTHARQTEVLDQVLMETPLRLPVLLLLRSDPDAERALAGAPNDARDRPELRIHALASALAARDPKRAATVMRDMKDSELPLTGLRTYVQNIATHDFFDANLR